MKTDSALRRLLVAGRPVLLREQMRPQVSSAGPGVQQKTLPWLKLSMLVVLVALGLFVAPKPALAATCTSNSTGSNWNSATHWDCGVVPQNGDTVIIATATTVNAATNTLASLTINASQTLTIAQNLNVNNSATSSLTVNGTMNYNSSTTRTVTVSDDVTIGSGGAITTSNPVGAHTHAFVIAGDLTNGGTLNLVNGDDLVNVTFNGSANQTVSGAGGTTNFNLITINNTGAANANIIEVTSTSFTTPNDFLTLTDGTFKLSTGATLTLTGANLNLTAPDGFIVNHASAVVNIGNQDITVAGGDFQLVAGTVSVGTGNDLFGVSSGTAVMSGGTLNVLGQFVASGGTTTISGTTINVDPQATASLGSTLNVFEAAAAANLTFTSGTVTIIDPHAATGTGNAVQIVSGAGTKDFAGGTIQLGNGVSTTAGSVDGFDVNCGGLTIGNLTVNNLATNIATRFVRLVTNACSLGDNLTVTAGVLQANGQNLSVAGNWTNNGTWTAGTSGTTTFNGTSTQTLSKSGSASTETFCNLTIASGAIVDTGDDLVAVANSGSCTTLTQNGILKRTTPAQNINSGSTFTFTDSRNVTTATLTRTAGTLGNTSVVVASNQSPNSFQCGVHVLNGLPILRWYDITAASAGTATVRLYYRTSNPNETNSTTAADIRIFHCDNITWTQLGGTPGSDANGNYVELAGVTTFSPFALAPSGTPTGVNLTGFNARALKKDKVRLKWATGNELSIVGFNLYRAGKPDGKYKKLNDELIPAKHPGQLVGDSYKYANKKVKSGAIYFYKLEIVKTDGTSEWSEIHRVRIK